MSHPNESEQNSHLAIVPLSNNQEEPIEAEIVEEVSIQRKHRRSKRYKNEKNKGAVSIVHVTNHLILDGECIETAQRNDTTPSKPEKTWQTIIVSPWTAASLVIVFAANMAIAVSQWNNASHQALQPTPPKPSVSSSSPIPSIDLTSETPGLNLNTLSLAKPNVNTVAAQPVEVPPSPSSQVAQEVPSSPNLSQALLPPVLQSQTTPTEQNTPSPTPTVVVPIPQVSSLPPPPILAPTTPTVTAAPTTQPPQNEKPLLETIPTLSEENNNTQSSKPQTTQTSQRKDDRSASSYYQRKRAESRSRSTPQNLDDLNQQFQNTQQQPNASSQTNKTQPRIEIQPPVGSNTLPSDRSNSLSVEKKPDGSIEIRSKGLR